LRRKGNEQDIASNQGLNRKLQAIYAKHQQGEMTRIFRPAGKRRLMSQITRVETVVLIHSAFVNRRLEGTAQIDGSAILRISSPR
jgi:hypothetical protein